jgi:hypothetical protein
MPSKLAFRALGATRKCSDGAKERGSQHLNTFPSVRYNFLHLSAAVAELGRRAGLRGQWVLQTRAGSNPARGTNSFSASFPCLFANPP